MDRELINQSIDYILEHFRDGLTVGDVAEHFHFSEAYFNRSFKAATGKSVYEFIMRLKMDQSAVDIKLQKNRSITDVGLDYGYSSTNYSTAFSKHHSISPSEFRESSNAVAMVSPFYQQGLQEFAGFDEYNKQILIREMPDFTVVYERVVGNYIDLKNRWPQFLKANDSLKKKDTLYIERFYDDPAVANPSECIYDICITTDEANLPDSTTIISGGKYAVYHYKGRIEDIFCSVQGVFSVWLPQSGFVMDRLYALNIYHEIDIESTEVSFDLCIPIKESRNSEVNS